MFSTPKGQAYEKHIQKGEPRLSYILQSQQSLQKQNQQTVFLRGRKTKELEQSVSCQPRWRRRQWKAEKMRRSESKSAVCWSLGCCLAVLSHWSWRSPTPWKIHAKSFMRKLKNDGCNLLVVGSRMSFIVLRNIISTPKTVEVQQHRLAPSSLETNQWSWHRLSLLQNVLISSMNFWSFWDLFAESMPEDMSEILKAPVGAPSHRALGLKLELAIGKHERLISTVFPWIPKTHWKYYWDAKLATWSLLHNFEIQLQAPASFYFVQQQLQQTLPHPVKVLILSSATIQFPLGGNQSFDKIVEPSEIVVSSRNINHFKVGTPC